MNRSRTVQCSVCNQMVGIPEGASLGGAQCPTCRNALPAESRHPEQQQTVETPQMKIWMWVVMGFVGYLVFNGIFGGSDRVPSSDTEAFANRGAFLLIADAHGENFKRSAAATLDQLAETEGAFTKTDGVALDPAIRAFAKQQAEYEQTFAQYARTEREVFENPSLIPLHLWKMQLQYHEEALSLAKKYAPEWIDGLETRIAADRRLMSKSD